jgi:superfamily II DNA/RNA helicase
MLPTIVHIRNQSAYVSNKGPIALILTPYQIIKDDIYKVCEEFLLASELRCARIYESEEKSEQTKMLNNSNIGSFFTSKSKNLDFIELFINLNYLKEETPPHVLIGNPIRILDLIDSEPELIDFSQVTLLIVDEYIQFRKSQTMDYVKQLVNKLNVSSFF